MQSKNICFLIGNLNHSGGTERVTSLIANALAAEGNQISILSLADGRQPFFTLHANIQTYSLYPHKISMKTNFFAAIWRIRKFVTQHQIDTLIVVDSISCVFTVPALFGLKIKHICWEHFNFNVDLGVSYRRLGRKWAAQYCDNVVTLTQRDKQLWQQGLKKIKAQMVAIANPSPYSIQEHTPSLAAKTILCVGRLTYQKGFDLLIEAWCKIAHQLPEWKIIIVGIGEDEVLLKQMVIVGGVEDSIMFAGQQTDMDSFYRQASFFCMGSRFEGLPMVLLEAQSYGLPIVAFDCDTGPAEIINKQTGFLVANGNVNQLAQAILKMAQCTDEQYQEMVIHATLNSKKFSLNEIIAQWKILI
ncbi:MAG: glycosyltransferase family 4 protein [Acinetobacter sp.]|jgi:glycosyltransferase involved in cell wall biosynthesis|nr:MAG: glycosyltransferase family 4 protein [Acinetobacter sp.]